MPPPPGPTSYRRMPLPTLTEDDIREQGERETLPPPVPIGQLVQKMMDLDAEPRPALGREGAPRLDGGSPPKPPAAGADPDVDDGWDVPSPSPAAAPKPGPAAAAKPARSVTPRPARSVTPRPGPGAAPKKGDEGVEVDDLGPLGEAELLAEVGDAYLARLGSRKHVPFMRMTRNAALKVPLDHWAGFVLALVDGTASVEEIVDASSLPEFEALRLLAELREKGLIDVLAPRR